MGRWLVLGGTVFLSKAITEAALARGHEVICAARGTSGAVPEGAKLVPVDRNAPGGLDAVRGERFDAVVDVAKMSFPWVRDALSALGGNTAHWTFVSSISAYPDDAAETHFHAEDTPLREPLEAADTDPGLAGDPEAYGRIKVASEQAVRAAVEERALIVRAGLICGPEDRSDRFGYWAGRFARGGRAVVPADAQAAQIVDVRDLAEWIVRSGEEHVVGTFDGSGPRTTLDAVLDEVAAAVGAADLERVRFTDAVLAAAGVRPWTGPRSLPLWLRGEAAGLMARDTSPAFAAGLRTRSIGETALGALATERALGLDRERRAGLSGADEQDVLRRTA